jgi:hypothetical protein
MKKFFVTVILALVCFYGCSKHEITPQYVTISFDKQLVSSNSMTRSTADDFLDIIEEHTSDYVNVTLKNLDLGKTFTCKSNESITIPVGNYEISAGYYPNSNGSRPTSDNGYMLLSPCLNCDTFTINMTPDTHTIKLNVYYSCYAVFALIDECKSCNTTYRVDFVYEFTKIDKYYIAYFTGDINKLTLTPYEDSNEFVETQYEFSTTYDKSMVYAEYGKYYVVHPQHVDKVTSSFTLEIPNMIEGEI